MSVGDTPRGGNQYTEGGGGRGGEGEGGVLIDQRLSGLLSLHRWRRGRYFLASCSIHAERVRNFPISASFVGLRLERG